MTESISFFPPFHISKEDLILKPPPQPSKLSLICKKIYEFFKKIWGMITSCFKPSQCLSKRQLRIIEEARANRHLVNRNITIVNPFRTTPLDNQIPFVQDPHPTPHKPDEITLISFCSFLKEFSRTLILDCLYDQKIQPQVESCKISLLNYLDQMPLFLKVILDTAKPLLNMMGNFDDPLSTVIVQQLLQVFLQEGRQRETEDLLVQRIDTLKDNGVISDEQFERAQTLVPTMMNWLYHSNNWFVNSQQPVQLHHFFLDLFIFMEKLSEMLDEGKLNREMDEIKKQIELTFEEDIKELISINLSPLTEFVGYRMSEIIANLPFQVTYDKVIEAFHQQTEGWIAANNDQKEQEKTIANAIATMNGKPIDPKKRREARAHLQLVREEGGKESFLSKQFVYNFKEKKCCHPTIKKIIDEPRDKRKEKISRKFISKFVSRIYSQILTPKSFALPSGTVIKIDGINRLIEKIVLPDNLEKIKYTLFEAIEKVLNKGEFHDKDNFKKYLCSVTHTILVEIVQSMIKDKISTFLSQQVDHFVEKDKIDEIVAHLALPSLIDQLFGAWLRNTLESHVDEMAPYFHEMFQQDKNLREIKENLIQHLYKLMKKQCVDFNFNLAGIGTQKFKTLAQPVIAELIGNLLNRLQEEGQIHLTLPQVTRAIKKYLIYEDVEANSHYGDLAMNTLLKIGKYEGGFTTFLINLFRGPIKGSISKKSSIAMQYVRKSYHLLLTSFIDSARYTLLDPSFLRQKFLGPEPDEQQKIQSQSETRTALNKRFQLLAALSHDVLGIGDFLGPSSKELESLITDIYTKMVSKPILNKNIIFKCMDIARKAVAHSSHKIDLSHI